MTALPPHDWSLPHRPGPAFASAEELAAWSDGTDGCPPDCPRRVEAEARIRSADLPCRCRHRQDDHRPVTSNGCTLCPCKGFQLAPQDPDGPRPIIRVAPMFAIPGERLGEVTLTADEAAARAARVEMAVRRQLDRQTAEAAALESPQARARRLDADADELGKQYRAALQAADAAWRAAGGRP